MQDCDSGHGAETKCSGSDEEMPLLPTRVIDVGPLDGSHEPFLLVSLNGQRGRYVALSHCWGADTGNGPLRTTRLSLASHQNEISMATLPWTFSDTVSVVRKLGVRYLWIDSLCIIQDSTADWEYESSRMGDYYWNSLLSIAAADSADSSQGLFAERDSAALYPCATSFRCGSVRGKAGVPKIMIVSIPSFVEHRPYHWIYGHKNVLDRRGWVLQERVLSTRILTFDRFQISFVCLHLHANECLPKGDLLGVFDWGTSTGSRLKYLFKRVAQGIPSNHRKIYIYQMRQAWLDIVKDYWSRDLTFDSDILPALSGLASRLNKQFSELGEEDEYLAGMWKRDLGNSICWYVSHSSRRPRPTHTAPSWSWASVKRGNHLSSLEFIPVSSEDIHGRFEFVAASIDGIGSNPFGNVTGGALTIKCKVQDLNRAADGTICNKTTSERVEIDIWVDDVEEFDQSTDDGVPVPITCALVAQTSPGFCNLVVLVREGVGDSVFYRRVGLAKMKWYGKDIRSSGWSEEEIVIR